MFAFPPETPATSWILYQISCVDQFLTHKLFHIHSNSGSESGVEQSLEVGVEWSSNLGVGWNLEQQKCEMGHPLTSPPF